MAETSHTRSNISGLGDVTLSHFNISATLLTATTIDMKIGDVQQLHTATVNANYLAATKLAINGNLSATNTQYIKLGSHKYMFWGNKSAAATIISNSAAVDASVRGSLYFGKGKLFLFTSDTAATVLVTT